MAKIKTRADYIKAAAKAHTDLNIFHAVIALMEGGLLSAECQTAEFEIVARCKREAGKYLDRYDTAINAAMQ